MKILRKLDRVELQGKRVLLRADLNVPMKEGKVTDATRIQRFVPTLQYLHDVGAIVIVTSHLGRPKGTFNPAMSLKLVADILAQLSNLRIEFIGKSVGQQALAKTKEMKAGGVALLENLRFHLEEILVQRWGLARYYRTVSCVDECYALAMTELSGEGMNSVLEKLFKSIRKRGVGVGVFPRRPKDIKSCARLVGWLRLFSEIAQK